MTEETYSAKLEVCRLYLEQIILTEPIPINGLRLMEKDRTDELHELEADRK